MFGNGTSSRTSTVEILIEKLPDDIGLYRDKFLIAACSQLQLRA